MRSKWLVCGVVLLFLSGVALSACGGGGGGASNKVTLTVDKFGDGKITGNRGGVDCGEGCQTQRVEVAPGTEVVLSPKASDGSRFDSWSGCDSVEGDQCSIAVDANKMILATFAYAEVKIPDTTKVLDNETVRYLTHREGSTFFFDPKADAAAKLQPGDVIVSAEGEGFLRKVTAVKQENGEIAVETADASLADAVEQGTIVVHQVLTPEGVQASGGTAPSLVPAAKMAAPLPRGTGAPVECETQKRSTTLKAIGLGGKIDSEPLPGLTVKGTACIWSELDLALSFKNQELQARFIYTFASELDAKALVGARVKGDKEWPVMPTFYFTPILVWLGPVPVLLGPRLDLTARAEWDLQGGLEVAGTVTATQSFGFRYSSASGPEGVSEFSSDRDGSLGGAATGEGKLLFGPKLGISVYNVSGLYLDARGFLRASADVNKAPWGVLYSGISSSVGIDWGVLSKAVKITKIEDFSLTLLEKEWEILSTPTQKLTVSKSGGGAVSSAPQGIDCGSQCEGIFNRGWDVQLTANAQPGWHMDSWSGCGSTSGDTCNVTMAGDEGVSARFIQGPPPFTTATPVLTRPTSPPQPPNPISPPPPAGPTSPPQPPNPTSPPPPAGPTSPPQPPNPTSPPPPAGPTSPPPRARPTSPP
jgi:hypothetical protein